MRIHTAAVVAAIVALAAGWAEAATYRLGSLEVRQPWSRPAASGTNGVGYMVVANAAKSGDALVGVESPAAAKVEIHSSSMVGGVMSMARQDRVAIPAGGQTTFGPGAYHLMFIRLTKALQVGDRVPATLTFASGARLKVDLQVSVAGPAGGMQAMPGMSH